VPAPAAARPAPLPSEDPCPRASSPGHPPQAGDAADRQPLSHEDVTVAQKDRIVRTDELARGELVPGLGPAREQLAIVRLAVAELLDCPDVPTAVILNEAVELASAYSTDDSGRFVNGVLATLATRLRP